MADKPPPAKRTKYISKDPRQIASIANCNRFSFKETFEVLTGEKPSQQRFTVHREPFAQRSKFLEAASSSRWTSGTKKPVDLTEHEPEVFASYMQCVYYGTVTLPELPQYMGYESLTGLFTLYLLADKLNDLTTANLVMDEIIRLSEEFRGIPNYYDVNKVYESTVAGSPLRRLCRDYYMYEVSPPDLEDIHKGIFCFQFLQDVILEFQRLATGDGSDDQRKYVSCVDREKCYYHQHDDEHPRCL